MKQTRMLGSPFAHMRRNVVAYLALFVALGGTSAYAANEWTGANIVDESLTGADIKNGAVASRDVTNGSLTGGDVTDGSLTGGDVTNGSLTGADVTDGLLSGADIANESIGHLDIGSQEVGSDEVLNDSLLQSDIRAGAVTSDEVLDNTLGGADVNDNSLTGADINESTLNLPQNPTTATFAGVNSGGWLPSDGSFAKVASKNLSAGSYALIGTANMESGFPFGGDQVRDVACELRNGASFIGGAHDRRVIPNGDQVKRTLTMTGGAQVPAGGEVSMWCRAQAGGESATYGHIMIIRLDGFS
jgi:uncharacterized protein YjbI with pentapeptide repeats